MIKNKFMLGTVTLLTAFTLSTAMTTSSAYAETVDTVVMVDDFGKTYNIPANIPDDKVLVLGTGIPQVGNKSDMVKENGEWQDEVDPTLFLFIEKNIVLVTDRKDNSKPSDSAYQAYLQYVRLREEALKSNATPSETPKEDTNASSTVPSTDSTDSTVEPATSSTTTVSSSTEQPTQTSAVVSSEASTTPSTSTQNTTSSNPVQNSTTETKATTLPVAGVDSGLVSTLLGSGLLSGLGIYKFKKRK